MKSIFSELREAYRAVEGTEYKEFGIKALEEIEKYINSGTWFSGRDKEEFLKHYRLPIEEYAKRTGRTEENVRLVIKRASDKIRERIGYNRIYTIIHGTKEEVEIIISILKWGTKNYILDRLIILDVVNSISQYRNIEEEYSIDDLQEEIKFLNKYTVKKLNQEMQLLDKKKLTYIFQFLNSKEGCDLEQKYILLRNIFNIEGSDRR